MNKELLTNDAIDINDEYAFGDEVEYVTPKIEHNIRPKGNQWNSATTRSACTICGAVNQIIRLFWIDLTPEKTNKLYEEVVKYCTKEGYVIGTWWYIPSACNAVCKWWNETGYKTFQKEQVFWIRTDWNAKRVTEAIQNGHLVGFWKELAWKSDAIRGIVDKDTYPKGTGHRLNYKCKKITKATGGADGSKAEIWVYDNYYGSTWQEYFILDRKKYVFKGLYWYAYIIMPVSSMKENIEKEKQRIALLKAVNATISVLTTTWSDLPEEFQKASSVYATSLRDKYPEARKLEKDQQKKVYQSVVDFLSYAWKYAWEDEQLKFADLAKTLREKYKLQ